MNQVGLIQLSKTQSLSLINNALIEYDVQISFNASSDLQTLVEELKSLENKLEIGYEQSFVSTGRK